MMKFLMKKSTLAVIALVLLALVGLPAEVLAQSNPSTEPTSNQELGPFKTFLERGAVLFAYTRNALYVAAAFVFLTIAWKMIYEGKMANEDWAKLLYMAIGFIILGVSGFIVGRLVTGTETAPQAEILNALPADTSAWGQQGGTVR